MILNQLTLRNFGIYRGEHSFELAPTIHRGRSRPVVLFGGINGGGKTTILDAVQLVLYGKRARCSKRGDKPYEEFLSGCINQGVDPQSGASIRLSFLYASEGSEHVYEVTRAWSAGSGGAIRERVAILKDGEPDGWMSENWNQLVEDLIPFGIAQLCFFDAEKIRFLAEDEGSSQALGEAIKSLLGLDLAERLVTDSSVLEGRIAKQVRKSDELVALQQLEDARDENLTVISRLKQDRAAIVPVHERALNRLAKAEENFAKMGGKHWEKREEQQRKRGELEHVVRQDEESLVSLAASELPLMMVSELLAQVSQQSRNEQAIAESDFIRRLLEERDTAVLKQLKKRKAAADIVQTINDFLTSDRQARVVAADGEAWLNLPDASANRLEDLLGTGLQTRWEQANDLLTQLESAQRELETVERSLAAAPKEDAIKGIADELKAASSEIADLQQQLNRINRDLAAVEFECSELDKQITTLNRQHIDERVKTNEHARIAALVTRTQDTMRQFLKQATARKIQHLSELVTSSFRFLLHKQSLLERVIIDPESFRITLIDPAGNELPKDQLSEGEKQIFAISVLWGLSKASARPLPAIIDTPMGRLDVEHRKQLVERYFPHASHQVIVLSTDTEIDCGYFQLLQPHIARAYHLSYDEQTRATQPEEGYFWDAEATVE
jgi:DNA sulfur modification protein DndD